jgi:hypothetical protein
MKYLSDMDMTLDGKWAVEWDEIGRGRWWQTFDTRQEAEDAIEDNETNKFVAILCEDVYLNGHVLDEVVVDNATAPTYADPMDE